MVHLGSRALRELADILDAIDGVTEGTGIRVGSLTTSRVTLPAERNQAMAHDFELGLTYNDALSAHVIEFEG